MALKTTQDTNRRHMMFLMAAFSAAPVSAMSQETETAPYWARITKGPENKGRMVATNVQTPTSEDYPSEDASGQLVLSSECLDQIGVMCMLILPKSTTDTAERAAAMPAFVAEWISGSTNVQKQDRALILNGLAWMDAEVRRRHAVSLTHAAIGHLLDVMNDVTNPVSDNRQLKLAGQFFNRLRALVIGGFYTPGTLITRVQPKTDRPVSPPYDRKSAEPSPHEVEYQGLLSAFKTLNIDVMAA